MLTGTSQTYTDKFNLTFILTESEGTSFKWEKSKQKINNVRWGKGARLPGGSVNIE